ncbi:hypothetical protein FGO68_gene7007 [Halteria grandinella]|uniref:Uncharacterized protein n=1 Tax=Halteria grandinella TaxID=5974 RepID=A0A8J8P778_HALGN|nr:hypothetical protein FGO68_gene7007 [Halteria grandinella]
MKNQQFLIQVNNQNSFQFNNSFRAIELDTIIFNGSQPQKNDERCVRQQDGRSAHSPTSRWHFRGWSRDVPLRRGWRSSERQHPQDDRAHHTDLPVEPTSSKVFHYHSSSGAKQQGRGCENAPRNVPEQSR